jgi:hypothetical protein
LEAEGWITMRWMSSIDSYDLMIGAAIVFFLAVVLVVSLI